MERELVTEEQLRTALAMQEASGDVLGEILVRSASITRMQLADVLAEQWDEMSSRPVGVEESEDRHELRVLLQEAQAARSDLSHLSDELTVRLTALETLVSGVSERLAALQEASLRATPDEVAPKRAPAVERRKATRRTSEKTAAARSRAK